MVESRPGRSAALGADDRFHGVFVAVSHNGLIATVLEQATPLLRRVERLRFASLAGRDSVEQHQQIIVAARSRDADTAAALSRDNWLSLRLTAES